MLDGLRSGLDRTIGGRADRLLRKADEAFHAHDEETCVHVIEQLYQLFDEAYV